MDQDQFLRELCQKQVPVTIYLTNGIRLQGSIEYFDQYGVLLRGVTKQFLYKHAISTVVPERVLGQAAAVEKLPVEESLPPSLEPRRPTTITRRVRSPKPLIRPTSDQER